ncbi:MAG: gliding motility-associated C-terminal domain-containing protein [bacterium]|nr:gliding motility-associated C-terminal domain-containing protein [bacterium]
MFLTRKGFVTGLILFCSVIGVHAQTLYWVGGSGNFNDPQHWSSVSGGSPSSLVPGSASQIIFDDNSTLTNLNVAVSSSNRIKGIEVKTYKSINLVSSGSAAGFIVSDHFIDFIDNENFQCSVPFEFKKSNGGIGSVSTGNSPLNSDFSFTGGSWNINKIRIGSANKLSAAAVGMTFQYASIYTGNLDLSGCSMLRFERSVFKASGSVIIENNANYFCDNSFLNRKPLPLSSPSIKITQNSGKYSTGNQINASGCITFTVTKPTCAPGCDSIIAFTIQNFTCFGAPVPSSVVVSVSTGTCPSVTGFTATSSGIFSLTGICNCGNDYNVFVDDEGGNNLDFFAIPITQPNVGFNANPIFTKSLTCSGVCNGSVGVSAFGGTAPYNFTITPPTGPITFSSTNGIISQTALCAGTLSIFTKDAANCTQSFSRVILTPPAYSSNSVATNVICNSACNGGFSISPTGGTPNYTVTFSTGPTFTAIPSQVLTQTGLCPGPITATLTDKNGCQIINSTIITEPTTITIVPTSTNISCGGSCSGVGKVVVAGGGGAYTYSWIPATGAGSINPALCATSAVGIHTVFITDIPHGCVKTQTFDITQIAPIVITPTITHVVCNGNTTGSATVNIAGGTAPFTYTWVRGSDNATVSLTPTLSGQAAGTYSVFVADVVPCNTFAVITITQSPVLTISSNIQSVTCIGAANGSATITPGGGNGAPFSYTWTPPVAGNTPIANGLLTGTYVVSVADASSCPIPTLQVVIDQPPAFAPTITTATLLCNSICNGSIGAAPTGGTGPYTYTLATSLSSTVNGTGNFTGLCGSNGAGGVGVYTLSIGDVTFPTNCAQVFTISLAQPATSLNAIASATAASCFSLCNGSLSGNAAGGTAPYSYNWSSSVTNTPNQQTLISQCAGPFTLQVVDSKACTFSTTINLTEPSQVTVSINTSTVSCPAGSSPTISTVNGAFSPTVTGGSLPYAFNWTGPSGFTSLSQNISNLAPGVYNLTVSANGCPTVVATNVATPLAQAITKTLTSSSCGVLCDGAATIATSGGTPTYTFQFVTTVTATNTTGLFSNVCGNYTATVIDSKGCSVSSSSNIPAPVPYLPGVTTTSILCKNALTGVITSSPTGGTAPYSYTLTGPVTNSTVPATASPVTFPGKGAGSYTLFIGDVTFPATCSQSFLIVLAEPVATLNAVVSTTAATCFSLCNGQLSGTAAGGTSPYTYNWTSSIAAIPNSQTIIGQCAGPFTLQVIDNNACTFSTTSILTQPTQVTVTVNSASVSCSTSSNAVLTATAVGGSGGPYSFTWNPGAIVGNPAINLAPGAYTVTAADGACPGGTASAIVSSPLPIIPSVVTGSTNCSNNCTGTATITAIQGTPGYTFSVSNPTLNVSNTTGLFVGLCSATYTRLVTDANGCTTPISTFFIGAPLPLTAALTGTQNSCSFCSGAATVTAGGGTLPYSFVWTHTAGVIPGATNPTVASLCPSAAPYTLTVTDAKSCTATASPTISAVIIVVAAGGQSVSCFGGNNGTASVSLVVGGNPAYTYSWIPTVQTTSVANSLTAGTYTVRVTDSSSPINCVGTSTIAILQPSLLIVQGTVTNVTCPGLLNGSITTSVSGGPSGAYTYSWSPSGQTVASPVGLTNGVHTVTVTSGVCNTVTTFTVGSPDPPITGTFTAVNPNNCAAPNNGSICIANGGGNLAYTYTWSPNPGNTNCISGLTVGAYQVTVTSNACFSVFTTTLSPPISPTISLASSQSVVCFGGNTGAATFTTTGSAPYTYTWSPATTSAIAGNSTSASSMSAGVLYTVTVRDANSCTNTAAVSLTQAPSFTVAQNVTSVTCNSASTGIISLTTTGASPGVPAYSYTWSNGTINTGTSSSISSLTASVNYSVTIKDGQNCTTIRSFTVSQPPVFSITSVSANATCFGVCNGSIAVTATGNVGPVSFNWPAVPSATFAGSTNSLIAGLCAGIYTVDVTDGPCTAAGVNTFQITQPVLLSGTVIINHNASCFGQCNGSATYSVTGGTLPYTYTWTGSSSTLITASTLCPVSHTVFATDAQGCSISSVFAIGQPTAAINATLTPFHPKCTGASNGSVSTSVSGSQGNVSYTWAPSGAGQNPTGLGTGASTLAGSSLIYTVTASDDSLCVFTKTVALIQPQPLMVNVTFTNPVCFGNCNGAAISTPSNAVGSTTVTWLPMGTVSPSIAGLCSSPFLGNPNIYTVNVVDDNNCTNTFTFGLTTPAQLNITYTAGPALCGVNNGSIAVGGTGGTGAYSFSWFAPVTATNILNAPLNTLVGTLSPGVYSVQLTDINNCVTSSVIPISASNGPTANTSSTTVLCNGFCTGTASLTAITPTNATLQWLPPLAGTLTAASLSSLCAGNYSVQITNPTNSCVAFYGFAISQPPPVVTTSTMSIPTCFGIADGSLSITPAGGVPSYTYAWTGPSFFTANTQNLSNVSGGAYTLNIIDANSCTTTSTYSIPVLNNIIIQSPIPVVSNLCFGDCNGSATINVVSTTTTALTATLSWSNGQFGSVASNLCAGIYSVIVTDSRGCNSTFSVPISAPPQITLTNTIVPPDCNKCNGSAVVGASGGNGPSYSYNWTTGETTPAISNLCGGLYQVVVSDVNNCKQLSNFIINSSKGFTGDTLLLKHEVCATPCSGAATVTAFGGAVPISYAWISPALSSTSNVVSNLCAGNYFVQMTDANKCVRTSPFTIKPANSLTVSAFVSPPACGSIPPNGSVQISVSGNIGIPTFSWVPGGATSHTLVNLGAGNYTVTVTEPLTGCSATKIVSISNLTGPGIAFTQKNVNCSSSAGSVSLTLTGTTAATFLWSNGATTATVANLQAGVSTVTVTDSNGCKSVRSFTILTDPSVEMNTNAQTIRCNAGCDGVITLLPVGGTLPYQFNWAPNTSTATQASSLCAGNYTVIVTDSKGCKDTSIVKLVNPVAITRTVNSTNSSCSTIADGQATVTVSGGLAPYKYNWTGPRSFTATTSSIKNVLAGSYTVTARDSLGCVSSSSTVNIVPTVTIEANAGPDVIVCPGTDVVISGSNSIGATNYIWLNAAGTGTYATTVNYALTANELETGTYQLLTLSALPNCSDRDSVDVLVYQTPFLDPGIQSYTIPASTSTVIGGHPTTLAGLNTHTWSPAKYLDDAFAQNPVTNNTVNVTFTVSVSFGINCLYSDTVQVLMLPEIIISSGFSPNGDGKNDYWIIDYIHEFPENTVEIYNRWGERLFISKGYSIPFDGKYKGNDLPVGTYYYVINLNNTIYNKPYTGPLTIFR